MNRSFFALPSSLSRVTACGGVDWCAKMLCLALTHGIDVADLECPSCGLPHLDDLQKCVPHSKHTCHGCKRMFFSEQRAVSNPLVSFVREHVGEATENMFAGLDTFSCSDVFTCVAALGVELDEVAVSEFIADNTLCIDVPAHVAADVDTTKRGKTKNKSKHKSKHVK